MYIGLVGPKPTKITKSANTIIQSYYMRQRKSEYRDPARTTVRMLDSLIRLSQAHCRLMYRTIILPIDAITAISLVDLSMQDCTLEDTESALHSTFFKYPDFEYLCTAKKLLTTMNLYEIWREDLLYYGKLLQIDTKTLENDIDNNDSKLFSKFNYVLDDNLPLSASLVTSSYFNNKKSTENIDNKDKPNTVTDKLAATLKKHATLNKAQIDLPVNNKKKNIKRKRKEVTIDTSKITNKKRQDAKTSKKIKIDFNMFDSDVEEMENNVNKDKEKQEIDIKFSEGESCDDFDKSNLQDKKGSERSTIRNKNNDKQNHEKKNYEKIDIKSKKQGAQSKKIASTKENNSKDIKIKVAIDIDKVKKKKKGKEIEQINHVNISDSICDTTEMLKAIPSVNDEFSKIGLDFKIYNNNNLNMDIHDNVDVINKNLQSKSNSNTTVNKLKQFEFSSNLDLDKYYKENNSNNVVKLSKSHKTPSSSSIQRQSASSSQISMFESSDCDIDLDI